MNAPLVSSHFQSSLLGGFAVAPTQRPKVMAGNGQLTRGAFIINDFLKNPHFSMIHPNDSKSIKIDILPEVGVASLDMKKLVGVSPRSSRRESFLLHASLSSDWLPSSLG